VTPACLPPGGLTAPAGEQAGRGEEKVNGSGG